MRQLWGNAIEENHKNAMLNREQSELSRMKEYYGAYVIEAIQALSKDDDTEDKADNSPSIWIRQHPILAKRAMPSHHRQILRWNRMNEARCSQFGL